MILTMTDLVPDNENHDETTVKKSTFEALKTLKREMEFRNSELGKTWSELSRIMNLYQSELIQKHDELDSTLSPDQKDRISHLESVIGTNRNKVTKLEKTITDLEQKVLEKDSEIVRLRTEVHRLNNEVTMKDNLIQKIQNQMAQEAMEYQSEINSLKDILQVESLTNLVEETQQQGAKRRKTAKTSRASPQTFVSSADVSYSKADHSSSSDSFGTTSHNPPVFPQPSVFPSPQPVGKNGVVSDQDGGPTESHHDHDQSYYVDAKDESNPGDVSTDLDTEQSSNQAENRLLLDDVYGSQGGGQSQMMPYEQGTVNDEEKQRIANMINQSYTTDDERGRFRCNVCGRTFGYRHVVVIHLRTHYNVRPYSCAICHRTFTRRDAVVDHLRSKHNYYDAPGPFIMHDKSLT